MTRKTVLAAMRVAMARVDRNAVSVLYCPYCDKLCTTKNNLACHLSLKHRAQHNQAQGKAPRQREFCVLPRMLIVVGQHDQTMGQEQGGQAQ